MNHHYSDIRGRIAEPPKWWDEHAVPRYNEFIPEELANIYAEECCLLLICCQGCGQEFKVAISIDAFARFEELHQRSGGTRPNAEDVETHWLADDIRHSRINYGDPPNVSCCDAGPSMNSVPMRVLEYWRKSIEHWGWERDSTLEVDIHSDIEQE